MARNTDSPTAEARVSPLRDGITVPANIVKETAIIEVIKSRKGHTMLLRNTKERNRDDFCYR